MGGPGLSAGAVGGRVLRTSGWPGSDRWSLGSCGPSTWKLRGARVAAGILSFASLHHPSAQSVLGGRESSPRDSNICASCSVGSDRRSADSEEARAGRSLGGRNRNRSAWVDQSAAARVRRGVVERDLLSLPERTAPPCPQGDLSGRARGCPRHRQDRCRRAGLRVRIGCISPGSGLRIRIAPLRSGHDRCLRAGGRAT